MRASPWISIFSLVAASCAEGSKPDVEVASGLTCTACTDLYIVAHQDDDLLFMSPDLDRSIQSGNPVRTIYVTAGDAGDDQTYWEGREAGIRDAYAEMANVADAWTLSTVQLEGNTIRVETLNGAPNVSVVFLRLPNVGASNPPHYMLEELWNFTTPSTLTVDNVNIYGREELIDVLHQLMELTEAERISILDPTWYAHGGDHSDHIAAARFAFEAHQRYFAPHTLTSYRTYNIEPEIVNLSLGEQTRKFGIFDTYTYHDDHICGGAGAACTIGGAYEAWTKRQYSISGVADVEGRVVGLGGKCLHAASSAEQAPVELRVCAEGSNQRWHAHPSGSLRAFGKCLTATAPANGTNLVLETCAIFAPAQRFLVSSEGRILGTEAKCVDVEGAGTADGTPIQIWECHDVPQQRWTMEMQAPSSWSAGTNFSDADLNGGDVTKVLAFGLPDLDGNGRADACVRRSDGVWCALNAGGGSFSAYTRWTTEYRDAVGWGVDQHGTTLRYADLNGDNRDDICGRGAAGIICAHSTGGAFGASSLRTSGSDFGDADGFTVQARYRSINLGDIDNDGDADVCGRTAGGIRCALNNSSGNFAPASSWLSSEFTDAQGWSDPKYGATIMLGDIDADGRADVCGRGLKGIHCARSNGAGFHDPSYASVSFDFGDDKGWGAHIAYWGSIRLADINGDGAADACGRGGAGIWCSISQGRGFDIARLVMPREFTNTQGWLVEKYGATVRLGDLDGDGRADVCGRGANVLRCALGL